MKRITILLIGSGLAIACAGPASAPGPTPRTTNGAASEWVVGEVRVVGSMPVDVRTVIAPAEGPTVEVRGPLRDEIRRLSGAEVAVFGFRTDGTIEVLEYRIRSVDGAAVFAGVVEESSDGSLTLRTDRGEILRIEGAGGEVRAGQKVWLQGPATVRVQSYGVIRP
jgi:hypothetical protein